MEWGGGDTIFEEHDDYNDDELTLSVFMLMYHTKKVNLRIFWKF